MPVFRMQNPVMDYAWGSRSFIQELLGRDDLKSKPVAELWLGAHPKASSLLELDSRALPLADYIASDPERILGDADDIYSGRLPFLLKVLAADTPLSIQAHPDQAQAWEGFERENRLGLPLDAPTRNYRDPNHKPELICALTEFQALCGFRPYRQIISWFGDLGFSTCEFGEFSKKRDAASFQAFIKTVLSFPKTQVSDVLSRIAGSRLIPDPEKRCCSELDHYFAGDCGVLMPLFLHLVTLQPGQALFLPARVLHAYLRGAGIEIMANSDNVLRGGLTPKHVDVAELCRVLDFTPFPLHVIAPLQLGSDPAGVLAYPSPAREFMLRRLDLDGTEKLDLLHITEPLIILCTSGSCSVSADTSQPLDLARGDSIFAPADVDRLSFSGSGTIWIASSQI